MLLCREAGYFDLDEIATAVFENNGKLSILPKSAHRPATPSDLGITAKAAHIGVELIMDGRIMGENLTRVGRDAAWLAQRLRSAGHPDPREILLCIYRRESDELRVYPCE